jgi:hypothetical protein
MTVFPCHPCFDPLTFVDASLCEASFHTQRVRLPRPTLPRLTTPSLAVLLSPVRIQSGGSL